MTRHLTAAAVLLVTLISLAASQAVPQRIRVDEKAMAAQVVTKIAPEYPPLARQTRVQGAVILKALISKSGDVESLQLISGHRMLAPAALEAVKEWKYKPFLLNGEAVEVETNVTVNFMLADKEPEATGVVGDMPGGMPASDAPVAVPQASMGVPQRVRISSGVAQGLLIKKVPPVYPPDAKEQRIQGVIVLQVKIDRQGKVNKIDLVSGPPQLAPSAIEAVKQWKYKPYLLNGNPVEVETQVRVNFTLVG